MATTPIVSSWCENPISHPALTPERGSTIGRGATPVNASFACSRPRPEQGTDSSSKIQILDKPRLAPNAVARHAGLLRDQPAKHVPHRLWLTLRIRGHLFNHCAHEPAQRIGQHCTGPDPAAIGTEGLNQRPPHALEDRGRLASGGLESMEAPEDVEVELSGRAHPCRMRIRNADSEALFHVQQQLDAVESHVAEYAAPLSPKHGQPLAGRPHRSVRARTPVPPGSCGRGARAVREASGSRARGRSALLKSSGTRECPRYVRGSRAVARVRAPDGGQRGSPSARKASPHRARKKRSALDSPAGPRHTPCSSLTSELLLSRVAEGSGPMTLQQPGREPRC